MCCDIERRSTQFRPIHPGSSTNYSLLPDNVKVQYKAALFKGARGNMSSIAISSKPSLVKLPSNILRTDSSDHYEDTKIPLKPPCNTASLSTESEASSLLEEDLAEVLFESLSSLGQYEDKHMVDMEDDEIMELWHTAHEKPKPPTKTELKKMKVDTAKAGVISKENRPKFLFKSRPAHRAFTAKSA
ncbi:hypothetical protein ACHAXN_005015 [Cyclotella atomus]